MGQIDASPLLQQSVQNGTELHYMTFLVSILSLHYSVICFINKGKCYYSNVFGSRM